MFFKRLDRLHFGWNNSKIKIAKFQRTIKEKNKQQIKIVLKKTTYIYSFWEINTFIIIFNSFGYM